MIPRRISQMWLGSPETKPTRLMNTWRDKNPKCEYVVWTPEELQHIDFHNQAQIDATKEFSGKCDIMRYELLHRYGGFFVDADTECVNALDDFFFKNDRFTCYDNELATGDIISPDLINPAFMGCKPGDLLFDLIILEISKMKKINKPAWIQTGPRMFTDVCQRWQHLYPMKIYPSWYFIGTAHGNGVDYTGTDKVYSKHYYGSAYNLYGKLM